MRELSQYIQGPADSAFPANNEFHPSNRFLNTATPKIPEEYRVLGNSRLPAHPCF